MFIMYIVYLYLIMFFMYLVYISIYYAVSFGVSV